MLRIAASCAAAAFDAAQKRGSAKVHEYTVMMHAYLLNDLREEAEDLFVSPRLSHHPHPRAPRVHFRTSTLSALPPYPSPHPTPPPPSPSSL